MKSRRLGSLVLLASVAVVALVLSGALDVRVAWRSGGSSCAQVR